jgi:hypothetical protein
MSLQAPVTTVFLNQLDLVHILFLQDKFSYYYTQISKGVRSHLVSQLKLCAHLPRGTRYRSCLRHYATSGKVAGSIPDEVIEFFN